MDDIRGLFLGMPHGTTPAAVTTNKFQTFVHLYIYESFVRVIVVFPLAYKVGHI